MIDVPILPREAIRARGEQSVALERDILTAQEVAEYLQLTPDTVYRYIREGKLAAAKLGRHYRIPKDTRDCSCNPADTSLNAIPITP